MAFYIGEAVIKIIGLGIEKYFHDNWNVFDFSMIWIAIASIFIPKWIESFRDAKNIKAGKLLRLTRLNRVFRVFRAIKTVKIFNFFIVLADAFEEVKSLIIRIFICIPFVM